MVNDALLREQAAALVVQLADDLQEPEKKNLLESCQKWCAQSAQHEKIFSELQYLWQAASASLPKCQAKARSLKMIGGIALSLSFITLFNLHLLHAWMADIHTTKGEIRQVKLTDGSSITLNSETAVNIYFDHRQRKVELVTGEVLAQVAHDAQNRPFIVENRDGIARALGTRYQVKQEENATIATVIESSIVVQPKTAADKSTSVAAGNSLRYNATQLLNRAAVAANADSWVYARLVFKDAPLNEVVDALANYRSGLLLLKIDHPENLRFTGTLPIDNTDQALEMITQTLPVKTTRFSGYLTWIEAAQMEK